MRRFVRVLVVAALLAPLIGWVHVGATAATPRISGSVFDDVDRDGSRDPGEGGFPDVMLYLFDASGAFVASTTTASNGSFAVDASGTGPFSLHIAATSWWPLRSTWVPSTGAGVAPTRTVQAGESVSFGLRRIVRSTDPAAPIDSYTSAEGLNIHSYNDVVPARELYDVLAGGTIGSEAPGVTIRFDLHAGTWCDHFPSSTGGGYTYRAEISVAWLSWIDQGVAPLVHEYGHAWSLHHAYVTQQDPSLSSYLRARGLDDDPRVGSSYEWDPREMIAEDYRQLLGHPDARFLAQHNTAIPPAAEVAGLHDFLIEHGRTAAEAPAATTLTVTNLSITPQPVQTDATVAFDLSTAGTVTVRITDSRAREVKRLLSSASVAAGSVSVRWDRTDAAGRKVKRGTYQVVVDATAGTQTASARLSFSVA